jgi:hypothetical protein
MDQWVSGGFRFGNGDRAVRSSEPCQVSDPGSVGSEVPGGVAPEPEPQRPLPQLSALILRA